MSEANDTKQESHVTPLILSEFMYVMNQITNICLNDLYLLFWWNKRVQIMSSSKIRFKKQYGPTVLLDACGVSIMHSSTQSRSGQITVF